MFLFNKKRELREKIVKNLESMKRVMPENADQVEKALVAMYNLGVEHAMGVVKINLT